MKRTSEATPYLSWTLITRNCASTLENTLRSLRERTPDAEIVIVDTCSSDEGKTEEIGRRYADQWECYTGPQGTWSQSMIAFDDAAAARNRALSLARGHWVSWIDSDDTIPGPVEAEQLLRMNGRWQPNVEAAQPLGRGQGTRIQVTIEEALRSIEEFHPDVRQVWAPYLYRKNKDGTAAEWQERERFVRNDGSHEWRGKGHEVLVSKDPNAHGKIGTLASLLFVHQKEWNDREYIHSLGRHFNALIQEYEAGNTDARTSMYLENFSRILCPQRRGEFLKSAYEHSYSRLDRSRALMRLGSYAAENGFFLDMIEAFAGAAQLRPDLPDPWILGAECLVRAKEWDEAGRWYDQGLRQPYSGVESLLNPRDLAIGYRMRAAECHRKLARIHRDLAHYDIAASSAEAAHAHAKAAFDSEAAGPDKEQIAFVMHALENEREALRHARAIHDLVDYLKRNDESVKAMQLLECAPHTLEDHPLMRYLRSTFAPLRRHIEHPESYAALYGSTNTNVHSTEEIYSRHYLLSRIKFTIESLKSWAGEWPLRILEIGCFDGLCAFPVLEALPDATFVGVDLDGNALERFQARAAARGLSDRIATWQGFDLENAPQFRNLKFDAALFMEVIEHVPEPSAALCSIARYLRVGSRLFFSTPWGAGDRGRRIDSNPRDERGHVRAMTARELADALDSAGFTPNELRGDNLYWGATLYGSAHLRADRGPRAPITFAIANALWDWNASHVEATGIGASEETIVYLAKEIARDPRLRVDVFGPVPHEASPCEEIRDRVGYWTRQKYDLVNPGGPVIVSRAPSLGATVRSAVGKPLDLILWLQDTYYSDLNEASAKDYRAIVTLTEWHKELISHSIGEENAGLLRVIPNFLIAEQFIGEMPKKEPYHFVYASSPDRGLIRLLKLWPKILEKWPDATLDIFYGWEGSMALGSGVNIAWNKTYRELRTEYLGLCYQQGVRDRGRVNHRELAREFHRASVWAYPTHFAECGCLTAAKVRAAGCVPVCTPYAGLEETARGLGTVFVPMHGVGLFTDPTGNPEAFESYATDFLEGIAEAIDTGREYRRAMSEEAIERFRVERIAPLWLDLLGERWGGLLD